MSRTQLQIDADRRADDLRRSVAKELRQMRRDAGLSQTAVAGVAGIDPSMVSRLEAGERDPTFETYARVASALGADFSARVFPNTGPRLHDRHSVPMTELLLARRHQRWRPSSEVAVRNPVRGWIDQVLWDPAVNLLVATELESMLRRIEQLLRWSGEKAAALPSSDPWTNWARTGAPSISRLLVVRWTRSNREAASAARRLVSEAYPADPRDGLDALQGAASWPGPVLLWARVGAGDAELLPWRP